jgi:NADPH:quinone reductase-like Zn-dependent oxidoreductase
MKAAIINKYADYDQILIQETERPKITEEEILIKNHSSTINSGDTRIRKADPWLVRLVFGYNKPRQGILGMTYSGIVEETGSKVTEFKKGDQVFGYIGTKMGCHAQYLKVSQESSVFIKPQFLTHDQAASAFFGFNTALDFINKVTLPKKAKILIIGASGSVGTAFLQILNTNQDYHISTVTSKKNIPLMQNLGCNQAYAYEDTSLEELQPNYDLVIECVAKYKTQVLRKLLLPSGKLILVAALGLELFKGLIDKNVRTGLVDDSKKAMLKLVDFLELHKIKPVIGETVSLENIAKGYRLADSGHKVGNLVVTITPS